jgi:acetylornithine/N-succinyldiaminopimelate aminotransferase
MAKGLGGGVPIGAMCASNDVAAAFAPGTHGSTFGGSPLCTAAALAEITEIIDRKLPENAKVMGEYCLKAAATLPHVKEVRGMGLLVGIEFDASVDAVQIKHEALRRGLLTTAIGNSIIRVVPPLIVTVFHIDQAIAILRDSLIAVMDADDDDTDAVTV